MNLVNKGVISPNQDPTESLDWPKKIKDAKSLYTKIEMVVLKNVSFRKDTRQLSMQSLSYQIIDLQKKLEEYEKIEKRINELPFEINLLKEEEDKLIEKELLDQAEQKSHKRFTLLDELKSLRQLKDSFNDLLDLFGNCTFIIN